MNDEEITKRTKELAHDIMNYSRNSLLVNMRFLDSALSRLELKDDVQGLFFATDGKYLCYDPLYILGQFKSSKTAMNHSYIHVLMHCIFRHMFINTLVYKTAWDLACDIAVETVISGFGLKTLETEGEDERQKLYDYYEKKAGKLTAERIYRFLLDSGKIDEELKEMRKPFFTDDHILWYMTDDEKAKNGLTNDESNSDNNENDDGNESSSKNNDNSEKNKSNSNINKKSGSKNKSDNSENENDSNKNKSNAKNKSDVIENENSIVYCSETDWKSISEHIQTYMETFHTQGDTPANFMQNLRELNHEKYDYTSFLKKFAVYGEVMKINQDEFDYVFYTYGLKIYKKMPLIEPLEYKEVKRIKDFVIAIDTSGSVEGDLVQKFIQKTYNILKSTESFFSKINLYIIQCDAKIQEAVKITSQEKFDAYLSKMTLKGFGGTDFRPVFSYVNELINKKEFTNLKGIVYFTDGLGTFPEKKPDYNTAFVFIGDEIFDYSVPPWAIKIILQKDEI